MRIIWFRSGADPVSLFSCFALLLSFLLTLSLSFLSPSASASARVLSAMDAFRDAYRQYWYAFYSCCCNACLPALCRNSTVGLTLVHAIRRLFHLLSAQLDIAPLYELTEDRIVEEGEKQRDTLCCAGPNGASARGTQPLSSALLLLLPLLPAGLVSSGSCNLQRCGVTSSDVIALAQTMKVRGSSSNCACEPSCRSLLCCTAI